MSDILKRLNNLESERPTVLRSAAPVPSRFRRSSKRRLRIRILLFAAVALSSTFLYYQIKVHFYPTAVVDETTKLDVSQLQNQKNDVAIQAYQSGDYEKAANLFSKLVAEQVDRAEFHINLAMAEQKLSKFELAEEQLKIAVALDPKNGFAFNNLGLVAEQMKQSKLAENSFKKAVQLNPKSPDLVFNLASYYERAGQLKLSISTYENFVILPNADKKIVELVKKRIPRLNSLNAQVERDDEGT